MKYLITWLVLSFYNAPCDHYGQGTMCMVNHVQFTETRMDTVFYNKDSAMLLYDRLNQNLIQDWQGFTVIGGNVRDIQLDSIQIDGK